MRPACARALWLGCLLVALSGCGVSRVLPWPSQDTQPVTEGAQAPVQIVESTGTASGVSDDLRATYDQALADIKASNIASAKRLLLDITAKNPSLAGPWINLARIYTSEDNLTAAGEALDHAVAVSPGNCVALNEYGVVLRKLGDFEKAREKYMSCLAASPQNANTYYNLGILYELYLGRLDEALAAYRQYLQLSPRPEERVRGWVADLERRLES
ncbi:MAG: tetratricopeptide repeat protein [Pseudomonadales bacterium]